MRAAAVGRSLSQYLCAILNYSVLSSLDSIVRVCLHRALIRHAAAGLGRRPTTTPTAATTARVSALSASCHRRSREIRASLVRTSPNTI